MAAAPTIGRATRVERAGAAEADLTQALYEQYSTQIFRFCLHQLGSREEAEDAVQSTFLNAFRGLKRGVVPELESAWLFKIAHNVCLSRRRSSWRRGRVEAPTDFELVQETAPAPTRRADELIGLQDVLERMPEQQRRAILLREWQGLSYREIGEELELSQAAVETLIFRARRSLAQGLEQPAAPERRRRLAAGALGNLLSSLQSFLLGGGAAVKVAAAVAVVGAGTVVATAPIQHRPHHTPAPAPVPAAKKTPAAPVVRQQRPEPVAPVVVRAAAPSATTSTPRHHARHVQTPHVAVAPPAPTPPVVTTAPEAPAAAPPAERSHAAAPVTPDHGGGRAAAPGQVKKERQQPAHTGERAKSQAPSEGAHGKSTAPGQEKSAPGQQQQQDHGPPAATTVTTPSPVDGAPPVAPAPVEPGQGAPPDAGSNGQGHGNGK